MSEHTPGPWKTMRRTIVGDGVIICDMSDLPSIEEEKANGRLISTAPNGLELAKKVLEYRTRSSIWTVGDRSKWQGDLMEMARALIAKAEGK